MSLGLVVRHSHKNKVTRYHMYVFKFKGLMQLIDVREDDLFLYTDGDELPRPEILQFFKLYDGWSQPVAFQYKWSIYGFFWCFHEFSDALLF